MASGGGAGASWKGVEACSGGVGLVPSGERRTGLGPGVATWAPVVARRLRAPMAEPGLSLGLAVLAGTGGLKPGKSLSGAKLGTAAMPAGVGAEDGVADCSGTSSSATDAGDPKGSIPA